MMYFQLELLKHLTFLLVLLRKFFSHTICCAAMGCQTRDLFLPFDHDFGCLVSHCITIVALSLVTSIWSGSEADKRFIGTQMA